MLLVVVEASQAQDPFGDGIHNTVLGGSALSRISGVSTTNMSAGDGNVQSNIGSVALGNSANAASVLQQQSWIGERLSSQQENVQIKDRAYRGAEGWLSINQAAGQGNVQSNSFNVALGISVSSLSDASLQRVLAEQQGLSGTDGQQSSTRRSIKIERSAFVDAQGVVQVNQSAGTGNATSNSFGMSMSLSP
ncbi:hypothetical protein OM427_08625 [Halomonas sp. 18H]|uniref:hypothetical protein n=1 Tax=Halomonas almeriensis TaxID=308163 RepID=UPI00222FABD4|nr:MULTISPECIES: hypothetical protein [Halomonas]MCW4149592.1 hypothetical protein [Halomonas sp. 18H]MDN3553462.1 hypothetical protein [Halomonas almeriensis]